jgi:hypothetical protein
MTFQTGRGIVEVIVDCNGNGEAYFRGDDMGADIKMWEFSHPYHGTEYRILTNYRNDPPILQTRTWVNV